MLTLVLLWNLNRSFVDDEEFSYLADALQFMYKIKCRRHFKSINTTNCTAIFKV